MEYRMSMMIFILSSGRKTSGGKKLCSPGGSSKKIVFRSFVNSDDPKARRSFVIVSATGTLLRVDIFACSGSSLDSGI